MIKYNFKLSDNSDATIIKNSKSVFLRNKNYNFNFDKKTGFFVRWGETIQDDGKLELGIPEIADIEISTICSGINGVPCSFCYKGNTGKGDYMNFETFKKVFHNLPPSITQIAFGIGDIEANPDMWNIFNYCNMFGVIPNVTVNGEGITDEIADKLVSKCGAVAVSLYDKDKTYNTVKLITDKGLKQTNIHFMLSEETYDKAFQLMNDYKSDERLKNLNAIVFLSLKKQGRAKSNFNSLNDDKFKSLIDYALDNNVPIGFDSCSAQKFTKSIKDRNNYKQLEMLAESCESTLYSMYVNTYGEFFPCSFIENTDGWKEGIDMTNIEDFFKEVWYNNKTIDFRKSVIDCRNCNKSCPKFDI